MPPRSDSQSSVSSKGGTISTRELDITIYAPPTETNKKIFQQKNLTDSSKELLMRNLLQGKCKVTWNAELASKYRLMEAFQQRRLNPQGIQFKICTEKEYQKIAQEKPKPKKSSTSYDI